MTPHERAWGEPVEALEEDHFATDESEPRGPCAVAVDLASVNARQLEAVRARLARLEDDAADPNLSAGTRALCRFAAGQIREAMRGA